MLKPIDDGCELYCDNCGEQFTTYDDHKGYDIMYWHEDADGSLIRYSAAESDWQIVQDSDLCPDCWNDSSLEE